MKKVYLILTLFMTSFFFVSMKEVSATTYDWTLSTSTYETINEDFLKLREKVIEYCEANNKFYVIVGFSPNLFAYIYSIDEYKYVDQSWNGKWHTAVNLLDTSVYKYILSDDTLQISGSALSDVTLYPVYNLNYFLDTNASNITNSSPYGSTYNLIFNDETYTINPGDKFITVYDIYKIKNGSDNKFAEEKEMIDNFYSTIATKIGELAINISNNYTFIVIFGIFVLIFIFELIRRRLI